MVSVAFLFLTAPAHSCSPLTELTPQKLIQEADRIFVGTAVRSYWEIDDYSRNSDDIPVEVVTTYFKVRQLLKGPKAKTIKIEHFFPVYGIVVSHLRQTRIF